VTPSRVQDSLLRRVESKHTNHILEIVFIIPNGAFVDNRAFGGLYKGKISRTINFCTHIKNILNSTHLLKNSALTQLYFPSNLLLAYKYLLCHKVKILFNDKQISPIVFISYSGEFALLKLTRCFCTKQLAKGASGNALIEYTIIGAVILIAVIPSFSNLGKAFADWLDYLKGDMNSHIVASQQAEAAQKGLLAAKEQEPEPSAKATSDGSTSIKPSDYSLNLTNVVQTIGANGATSQLAQELQALAKKMKDSGEIDQAEADKILALANQGFRLADLENLVETQSKNAGSTQAFLASSINFNGKTMSMQDVAGIIGYGTPTDLTEDIKNDPNYMMSTQYASPETLTFLNLYNDATGVNGIQNQEAKNVVTKLSSEIAYLTDAVSNLIYGASDPNITLENLRGNTASQATVYDSYGICYTGGATCK
jgi:Flp pilus assembly pilin Flp